MKKLMSILASGMFFGSMAYAEGETGGITVESGGEVLNTGVASSIQVKARPEGLATVGLVMTAGSDAASASFQSNILPDLTSLLNVRLGERVALKDTSAMRLDPSKLVLQNQSDVRVYFVGEGAGYHNTVGFNTWEVGQTAPKSAIGSDAQLIFPDASSPVSTYDPASTAVRTNSNPLLPGDFVNLGSYGANTLLDFFLISNGTVGGRDAFSSDPTRNPDGLNHVVFFALADSPFLIIAFEDMLKGGDRDYNDAIIAIDIGRANVANLMAAPEPAFWAVLAGFLGIAVWIGRRRQLAV